MRTNESADSKSEEESLPTDIIQSVKPIIPTQKMGGCNIFSLTEVLKLNTMHPTLYLNNQIKYPWSTL
ncbi:hypothetical protein JTE90_021101 [Oedothorax gibbosus]|uniref:Uncharacterized protein n=1 Tax=Oedothorax gibbosus TaxID=931172 RepID=A0AAV6TWA3_9ARAC|nr:hypothetical protein JTE90_021101 [Oedothorax gibbosus]